MSTEEEKPVEEETTMDEGYALYEEPTVFSKLTHLRYFVAGYLGLFVLLFLIGLFMYKEFSELSGDGILFSLEYTEVEFSDLFTITFILAILFLIGVIGILATQDDFSGDMGSYLYYALGGYLFLVSISFILRATTGDGNESISMGLVTWGLLLLGLAFIFAGYQDSGMSTLEYNLKDIALGAGSLIYGLTIYLTGGSLDFDNSTDTPAISGFFGIFKYETINIFNTDVTLPESYLWFFPTFHEWILGGLLWIVLGVYFLVRGLEIDLGNNYDLLETGILVITSLALFWFNISFLFMILFGGITGIGVIIIMLANLVGLYLSYEINLPFKTFAEEKFAEFMDSRASE